ncbi:hypothetical protein NDI54_05835 [Haloarcula sp. S1AR25-5A]|uniref:Uncharacterized protein n=1 Tax=Haloarcula terrestris TaxID=2950533 RepID=A0AAE4EWR6_9EURY|nr:hypothetical protein [Haloarcula terrestris]MDS0220874.1 hypothetical protein [Haloarcula terrestris]
MTRLNDVDATVGIADGRVAMNADIETPLRLETPDRRPLSSAEPHATLRLAGDDVRVAVELDGEALDALADALHQQRGDR